MKQKALPPRAPGVLRCQWRQGQFGKLLTPGLPLPDLIEKGAWSLFVALFVVAFLIDFFFVANPLGGAWWAASS